MPKFHYRARGKEGKIVQGTIEAIDPWLARKTLTAQNLVVLEVNRFSAQSVVSFFEELRVWLGKRVSLEEKLMFVNQLQTGVSIGLPIQQLLDSIAEPLTNEYLKSAVKQISKDVGQGYSLHKACEKHPGIFDNVSVALIRTGEVTGELEATLVRLSGVIEQRVVNRSKIKAATFYPKIVMFFMAIVTLVLVYFVIPKFKTFLSTLGQDLPLITKIVVGTSDFFISYWYLLGLIGFGAYSAFKSYASTEAGRLNLDRLKLKIPLLGTLFLDLELNNYCVILDLLLASGLTLFESFETLKETQSNQVVKNEIDRCSGLISSGATFATALQGGALFPLTFTSMVSIGEEAGKLPTVLQKLGHYYKIKVDFRLDTLSKLIEPILLVFIFIMVGAVAASVFLPIWKMSASIH